jgi:hypothetical protein
MEQLPKNENQNDDYDWKEYYELHKDVGHTLSLEKAVTQYCEDKGNALDIGAGNLRDTKFLLEKGFTVTAIDPSPASAAMAEQLNNPELTMVQEIIGTWDFPKDYFCLVNAEGILFHFSPQRLDIIMNKIKGSIKSGGVFSGNFLGVHDGWNNEGTDKNFFDREGIQELFAGFDIKQLGEGERDGTSAASEIEGTNIPKHWHMFRIIAVKK